MPDTQTVPVTTGEPTRGPGTQNRSSAMQNEEARCNAMAQPTGTRQKPCISCGSHDHVSCCARCGGKDGAHYGGCER
jgi:hypothetical protein